MGEAPGIGHQAAGRKKKEPDLRLLCERCGYHLKGLKRTDVCPECGKPVVESLPERRRGSAWQHNPGVSGMVRAALGLARRPIRYWDVVQTRDRGARALLVESIISSSLVALTPVPFFIFDMGLNHFSAPLILGFGLTGVGLGALMLALSWIEMVGIRIVGARRGWRIDKKLAWILVAHASIAWCVSSILVTLVLLVPLVTSYMYPGSLGQPIAMAGGFLIGLLAFETLVYIGMQKMKYANAPGSERELAEDDAGGSTTLHPPTATGSSA